MRLLFVRHGAASYWEQQVIPGATGCPGLTPDGRNQAALLCTRLQSPGMLPESAVLLSSPLARAMETARLLSPAFPGNRIQADPDLEEMGVGIADGMRWSDFASQFGEFDVMEQPARVWAPGGESWNMFRERVLGFLDRVRSDDSDRTVVAVTHGGVIEVSMRVLLGIPNVGAPATFFPSNTGVTEWSFNGGWKLERYNDTSHLSTSFHDRRDAP